MSTNYYFKIKNVKINLDFPTNMEKIKKDIMDILKEELEDLTTIHIGKRSAGWKPLFYRSKYYASVKEIRDFYAKHRESLIIVDEYDNKLTFKELEKELINWKDKEKSLEHFGREYYKDPDGYDFTIFEFS